jgi:hypothetical protein
MVQQYYFAAKRGKGLGEFRELGMEAGLTGLHMQTKSPPPHPYSEELLGHVEGLTAMGWVTCPSNFWSLLMFNMFTKFFTMLAVLFEAGEKLATATLHVATVAEEAAGAMADQSRVDRIAKLALANAKANTSVEQTKFTPVLE